MPRGRNRLGALFESFWLWVQSQSTQTKDYTIEYATSPFGWESGCVTTDRHVYLSNVVSIREYYINATKRKWWSIKCQNHLIKSNLILPCSRWWKEPIRTSLDTWINSFIFINYLDWVAQTYIEFKCQLNYLKFTWN